MTKSIRLTSLTSAIVTTVFIAGAGQALAQASAGITESPQSTSSRESAGDPSGPQRSKMPLVDPSLFETMAEAAGGAATAGKPGVLLFSKAGVASRSEKVSKPEAYGTSTAPYTTARVAVSKLGRSKVKAQVPVTSFPYRATGKIFARWGNAWYVCTASLVRKSVLITAAHCIFNYGKTTTGWADEVRWYPANLGKKASGRPYGVYNMHRMYIPTPYYNGTDSCTQTGVVCNNDIATIVLKKRAGKFAGKVLGWYSYGWNGYSYKRANGLGNTTAVQITQLGYPAAFDGGYQMMRTDAVGWYTNSGGVKGTQIGSAQTGGSSGGPWLTNFGTRPKFNKSASLGFNSKPNVVVGVTSYGSTSKGYNRQGASFFGQNREYPRAKYGRYGGGNIGSLMNGTCKAQPAYC